MNTRNGAAGLQSPLSKRNLKNTDIVDTMISKVKRDLLLSVNQPMNSAYLEFIGIHFIWCNSPPPSVGQGLLIPEFLDHTQRRPTVGRTPLDEGSARCRDLYLTTHNTHNKQTSLPPVAFEPTISEGEQPQTYALQRAATGTGFGIQWHTEIKV